MKEPCATDPGATRRERIARLGRVEDFMIHALLQAPGTASEGAVASALGALLDEYHSEVLAHIGELALAAHQQDPAKSEGAS